MYYELVAMAMLLRIYRITQLQNKTPDEPASLSHSYRPTSLPLRAILHVFHRQSIQAAGQFLLFSW